MFYAFFAMFVVSATIVWEDILPASAHTSLWGIFITAWLLGIYISWRMEKDVEAKEKEKQGEFQKNDTLSFAQSAYLRREWFEAERMLHERLLNFPEDIPARLLLISLLRRLSRLKEAENQLKILETSSTLGVWVLETYREREWIAEEMQASETHVS